eukprot:TRINITY_DN584_c1_g1_i4.p3 TRINITY_DN584_c1_g1~~TRINITY_DN584_c1_g1_i4.p3  ORF type:complete len:147 (+),score=28.04 TRINITY_DN584_c1_g1_i4:767-1207(+)
MLPLSLLKSATGCPILIELKNGETYNAKLRNMDHWMNLMLVDSIRTSSDGSTFWTLPSVLIRGNTVKYIRVPELVLSILDDERAARQHAQQRSRTRRSGGGRSRSSGGRKGGGAGGGGGGGGGSGSGGGSSRGGASSGRRNEPLWL